MNGSEMTISLAIALAGGAVGLLLSLLERQQLRRDWRKRKKRGQARLSQLVEATTLPPAPVGVGRRIECRWTPEASVGATRR